MNEIMREPPLFEACDYSTVDHLGKLTAMGIFGYWRAKSLPVVPPPFHLIFRGRSDHLSLTPGDIALLTLNMRSPSGDEVLIAKRHEAVVEEPVRGVPNHITVSWIIAGLTLSEFGVYTARFAVNGAVYATKELALTEELSDD